MFEYTAEEIAEFARFYFAAERWAPVVGFEKLYEVSEMGRIFCLRRNRLHPQNIHPTHGYWMANLKTQDGIWTADAVHRMVKKAFDGEPPFDDKGRRKIVCHNNGVHGDTRLSNLRYGTHKENSNDRVAHGTMLHGEKSPTAKLTESEVGAIRAKHRVGASRTNLAANYGVHYNTIHSIVTRQSWKHIQ